MIRVKNISQNDVYELVSKQESHFFDKKAKEIDGKKIQKIAVAFANADGGDFIIGIKDDKDEKIVEQRWDGYSNQEDFNKVFQNLIEITPSLMYIAEFLFFEKTKTYALKITIEKSEKHGN